MALSLMDQCIIFLNSKYISSGVDKQNSISIFFYIKAQITVAQLGLVWSRWVFDAPAIKCCLPVVFKSVDDIPEMLSL